MHVNFCNQENETMSVTYAESFKKYVNAGKFDAWLNDGPILIISQATLYERCYDLLMKRVKNIDKVQWYILPNLPLGESFSLFSKTLTFIEQMKLPRGTKLLSLGNETINQIGSFIHGMSPYIAEQFHIASDLSGFLSAISGYATLTGPNLETLSERKALPNGLFYDTMLSGGEALFETRLSLFRMIQIGLQYDVSILNRLYEETDKRTEHYVAFSQDLLELAQKQSLDFEYGKTFTQALFVTEGSYALNYEQKRWLGLLLTMCCQNEQVHYHADFKKIKHWLEYQLGESLSLPKFLLTSDLVEQVALILGREQKWFGLSQMGSRTTQAIPTLLEIERGIESFRSIE